MKYTIGIIAVASLCFILLSGVTNQQQRTTATEEQQSGASISGVLLAQDGAPLPKTEVRLVMVRLVNLLGKEISKLPTTESVIIDSYGKAVAVAETDASGKFEFKDIKPGRYALSVPKKARGVAGQLWLEENSGKTAFFDVIGTEVIGTEKLELGKLKAARQ
jgi:hypothetical protein